MNEVEVGRVREIFQLYLQDRSLLSVVGELRRRGWTLKSWTTRRGNRHAGQHFCVASLRRLLTNVVYIGKVTHRGALYDGEQPPIIDPATWAKVSADFEGRRRPSSVSVHSRQDALLAGLLYCKACGEPMIAAYSEKGGRRYRYYVCRKAQRKGWASCPTKSVSARAIESSTVAQLSAALACAKVRDELHVEDSEWQRLQQGDARGLVRALVERISYDRGDGVVSIELKVGEPVGEEDGA